MRLLSLQFAAGVVALSLLCGCSRPSGSSGGGKASAVDRPSKHGGARDLAVDEENGGHTLKRHVGRSDRDLQERLRREPGISAASTYIDRHTAEEFIGNCLADNESRIGQWLGRDRHPNLALDCLGDPAWPIGRSLRRGQSEVEPCSRATVVLKWKPSQNYYVLTSYPDCR